MTHPTREDIRRAARFALNCGAWALTNPTPKELRSVNRNHGSGDIEGWEGTDKGVTPRGGRLVTWRLLAQVLNAGMTRPGAQEEYRRIQDLYIAAADPDRVAHFGPGGDREAAEKRARQYSAALDALQEFHHRVVEDGLNQVATSEQEALF